MTREEVPAWEWAHYYDVNVDQALFEEYRKFSVHKHRTSRLTPNT